MLKVLLLLLVLLWEACVVALPEQQSRLLGMIERSRRPDYLQQLMNLENSLYDSGQLEELHELLSEVLERGIEGAYDLIIFSRLVDRFGVDGRRALNATTKLLQTDLVPAHKMLLHFALGRMLDVNLQFDEAYFHFAEANAMKSKMLRDDGRITAVLIARMDGVRRLINTAAKFVSLHTIADGAIQPFSPVFVIGFPRSGTTLVDSILAAHPQVHSFGEMSPLRPLWEELEHPLLSTAAASASTDDLFHELQQLLGSKKFASRAQLLLSEVTEVLTQYRRHARYSDGGAASASHIVFKVNLDLEHVWLIPVLFANARLVLVNRGFSDTVISNFMTNFDVRKSGSRELVYSFNLEATVDVLVAYRKLAHHWEALLLRSSANIMAAAAGADGIGGRGELNREKQQWVGFSDGEATTAEATTADPDSARQLHAVAAARLPTLTVEYESIVDDPEGSTRRLLHFLGLPFERACLHYYLHRQNKQSGGRPLQRMGVSSNSLSQVQLPVYNRSVSRGAAYAHLLPGRVADAEGRSTTP
jgi:hypothetical protein